MDWFAKHEPVRMHFNFLSNLFNQENPSRLTLKHEPPRKHFNILSNLFNHENPSHLTLKHEPVRKHFNFLNNLFNHEKIPRKWIGSQSMNWFASISIF